MIACDQLMNTTCSLNPSRPPTAGTMRYVPAFLFLIPVVSMASIIDRCSPEFCHPNGNEMIRNIATLDFSDAEHNGHVGLNEILALDLSSGPGSLGVVNLALPAGLRGTTSTVAWIGHNAPSTGLGAPDEHSTVNACSKGCVGKHSQDDGSDIAVDNVSSDISDPPVSDPPGGTGNLNSARISLHADFAGDDPQAGNSDPVLVTVPEPGTMTLALLGLLAVILPRRSR